MPSARLLFSTSSHPGSAIIRAFTWSSWSHVALIDGDQIIEAAAPHGVRRAPLAPAIERAHHSAIVSLPCSDPDRIIAAAASQIGKPYDYTAVIGLGLHRDWQETDAWFCSELVAWAFARAGESLFRAEVLRRVTPQHLWMLRPESPVVRLAL